MGLINRVWNWFGIQGEEEYEYDNSDRLRSLNKVDDAEVKKSLASVVAMPSKNQKIIISEPEKYNEAKVFANHLKDNKQVILNFEKCQEDSRRILDFMLGATYSLDGHTQQIGTNIFLFTPSNYEINDQRDTKKKSASREAYEEN